MRIIAIANQKGGVGKTTTAQNIATGMAKLGKKVMVIDCDQQRHLTTGCGVPLFEVKKEKQENVQPTLIDVLRKLVEWKDAAIEIFPLNEEGGACVLIPASSELAAFSILFAQDLGKEFLLKEALKTVPDFFDIILLDSPPNLDLVAVNVLVAATDIVIPVQCESYSLNGVEMLIKTVNQATQRLNPALKIMGIVPTMFDGRKRLCKDVRERLKEMFPNKILNTTIRDSVSLAEAPSHGKSIFEYDPKGYGAEDYFQLSKEIINIIEKEEVKNG